MTLDMSTDLKARLASKERGKTAEEALAAFAKRYGVTTHPDDPLPYGTDSKRSLIAKAVARREGVEKVSSTLYRCMKIMNRMRTR